MVDALRGLDEHELHGVGGDGAEVDVAVVVRDVDALDREAAAGHGHVHGRLGRARHLVPDFVQVSAHEPQAHAHQRRSGNSQCGADNYLVALYFDFHRHKFTSIFANVQIRARPAPSGGLSGPGLSGGGRAARGGARA